MDKDLRITSLEAQIDVLRSRVDELEHAMFGDFAAPLSWKLSANEERIFAVLLARPLATKEALLVALYDNVHRDRAEPKIVDVFICKLRSKLKRAGIDITIDTVWGRGWSLSPDDRARLRSAA